MISKALTFLVLLPLALLLVIFSVLNRAPVTLTMDVFGTTPQWVLQAPLFVVVLAAVILGVILGGIGTFVGQARHRARAARRQQEVDRLRREVDASNERVRQLREERERVAAATTSPTAPSRPASSGLAAPSTQPALPAPRAA